MPHPTKASSAVGHVAGHNIIADDDEGGLSYVQRLMASGGPAGVGKGEPESYASLFPGINIYLFFQYSIQGQNC